MLVTKVPSTCSTNRVLLDTFMNPQKKSVRNKLATAVALSACSSVDRVSDQLSASMHNQTLPHGDEAMAETWEHNRNVAWTQVSCHSKMAPNHHFLFAPRAMQVTV